MTFADVEVRTRSLVTAATLLLLGHEPLEIRRDAKQEAFSVGGARLDVF